MGWVHHPMQQAAPGHHLPPLRAASVGSLPDIAADALHVIRYVAWGACWVPCLVPCGLWSLPPPSQITQCEWSSATHKKHTRAGAWQHSVLPRAHPTSAATSAIPIPESLTPKTAKGNTSQIPSKTSPDSRPPTSASAPTSAACRACAARSRSSALALWAPRSSCGIHAVFK